MPLGKDDFRLRIQHEDHLIREMGTIAFGRVRLTRARCAFVSVYGRSRCVQRKRKMPHELVKSWVNKALASTTDAPATAHLSVLLTKAQLTAVDINDEIGRRFDELDEMAPAVSRELHLSRDQVSAVRTEMSTVLYDVGVLKERSEASVATLRGALHVRESLVAAASLLQRAECVTNLACAAEASFAHDDPIRSASCVLDFGGALEALEPVQRMALFPNAMSRQAAMRRHLLDQLQPPLLQALCEHDIVAISRLSSLLSGLDDVASVRECYVKCQQKSIFECWHAHQRSGAAAALRALWACLEAVVHTELPWVTSVFHDDASLLPDLLGEALEAIGPQKTDLLVAPLVAVDTPSPLPSTGVSGVAAKAFDSEDAEFTALLDLAPLWHEALQRAAALAVELGGQLQPGVARVTDALLLPFEPAQRRYARALRHVFLAKLPAVPDAPTNELCHEVVHSAVTLERLTPPLFSVLQAAWGAALEFCGPLGAAGTAALLCDLAEAHTAAFATALLPLRPAPPSEAARGSASAPVADEAGSMAHDALGLLRSVHGLLERMHRTEAAFDEALEQVASACRAAPLQTAAQRAAAAELRAALLAPPAGGDELAGLGLLRRARTAVSNLLTSSQGFALRALTAPIESAVRVMHSGALLEVWRGHGALYSGGGPASLVSEREAIATAMVAFSASPQAYITQVGERLLELPTQLEPFATDATLSCLSMDMRRPPTPAVQVGDAPASAKAGAENWHVSRVDLGGASEWLEAVGLRTVSLFLDAVAALEQLSMLGAKQLAADVHYLDNILVAGLSLPPDARLAELAALLTTDEGTLPAAVQGACALPEGYAATIAKKRRTPRSQLDMTSRTCVSAGVAGLR